MQGLFGGTDRRAWRAILGTTLLLGVAASGLLLFPAAPASATPWPGPEPGPTNLIFYLHNSTSPIIVGATPYLEVLSTANDTVAPWAVTGGLSVGKHYDSVAFVATPQLTAPLVLNGSVAASVYMNQTGSSLTGGTVLLSVYAVTPSGVKTLLGSGSVGTVALGAGGSVPARAQLVGPNLTGATVPAGDSIDVTITVSGNTATYYGIWWGNVNGTTYESQVSLPATTYLTVGTPKVVNSTGAPEFDLSASSLNKTVTVSAVVSDPLGAYDFSSWPVFFTIFNATGVAIYGPVSMTAEPAPPASGAPNSTYYASFNYSGLAPGVYSFNVSASDNTNHNVGNQNTLPAFYGRLASSAVTVDVGLPPVPVTVKVVDDRSVALKGAVVRAMVGSVLISTNTTDAAGEANFSLPNDTSYNFTVYWQGIRAGNFTELVNASGLVFQLSATVLYPTFLLETSDGLPVPYALVSIVHPNGTTLPLVVSNAKGEFTLAQVPAGDYTFTVIYDDVVVLGSHPVPALSDASPIPVTVTGVYPLTVTTSTSGGSALSGIFVTVISSATGATIASGVTNSSGALSFLVPVGTYEVVGDWSTTYYLTPVQQTVTEQVSVTGVTSTSLQFTKAFPSFTQTNEFYLVLAFAALGIVIVVLALLLVRSRRKQKVPPLTPAPAISPPEATKEPETKS